MVCRLTAYAWFTVLNAAERLLSGQCIADRFVLDAAAHAERVVVIAGECSDDLVATTDGMPENRLSIRRKRLLFRSWSRGTQESDLILGSFADSTLGGFEERQLDRFEALLDCSDLDLFEWILGGSEPPTQHDHDVLRMLRAFWTHRAACGRAHTHFETKTP